MRRSFSEFQNVSVQTAKLADYHPVSNPDVAAAFGRASRHRSLRAASLFGRAARQRRNVASDWVCTVTPGGRANEGLFLARMELKFSGRCRIVAA